MTRFVALIAAVVALSQFPGGNAALTGPHANRGSAAAHRKRASGFRQDKGWPGFKFPADPWGIVIGEDTSASTIVVVSGSGVGNVEPTPEASSVAVASSVIPFPTASYSSPAIASISIVSVIPSANSTVAESSTSTSSLSTSSSTSTHKTTSKATTSSTALAESATAALVATPKASPSAKASSAEVHSSAAAALAPAPAKATSSSEEAAQSTPAPVSSSSSSSGSSDSEGSGSTSGPTSEADIQAYLTAHNSVRAQHGATPLTYSQDLAAKAQQWANGCVFKHSGGTLGPFGENLAAGSGDGYGISQAIESWTSEVSQYNPNNPVPSHFTQVVWKGTTQVGCALQNCDGIFAASFGKAHFYVCEYSAQGNVIGEFAQNVQV